MSATVRTTHNVDADRKAVRNEGAAEMAKKRLAISILLVLLAACAPTGATVPLETVDPGSEEQIGAARNAEEALAEQLAVPVETIQVVKVEDAEWPDACLGLAQAGEACALVITPGFRVTLLTEGKQYVYRTDESGAVVRLERIEA